MLQKTTLKIMLLVATINLVACSSNFLSSQNPQHATNGSTVGGTRENPVATGGTPGGSIANRMDETDKSKMYHALDSAPGKSTTWVNASTGINYTVVPTKKVTLNGNPYCREYETTAEKGDKQSQINGTACVGQDGNWHSV